MALPLSFAVGVVLVVAGTLASPPLTGVLYLTAVLAGAGVAYVLLSARGWENEAPMRPTGEERAWYGEVQNLRGPEHEAADGETSP